MRTGCNIKIFFFNAGCCGDLLDAEEHGIGKVNLIKKNEENVVHFYSSELKASGYAHSFITKEFKCPFRLSEFRNLSLLSRF